LSRIIDQSRASTVLAGRALLSLAAEVAPTLVAREIFDHAASDIPVAAHVSPDAPAYVCYTSGSTGEPKGVVATHRKTVTQARASTDSLNHGPDDRHTLLHSLAAGAGGRPAPLDSSINRPRGAFIFPARREAAAADYPDARHAGD
jgi:non-ribosomal peptide synthetase component F